MSPVHIQKNVKRLVLNRETLRTLAEPVTREGFEMTSCGEQCNCQDVATIGVQA